MSNDARIAPASGCSFIPFCTSRCLRTEIEWNWDHYTELRRLESCRFLDSVSLFLCTPWVRCIPSAWGTSVHHSQKHITIDPTRKVRVQMSTITQQSNNKKNHVKRWLVTCHAATEPKSDMFWCKVFNHALQIADVLMYHQLEARTSEHLCSIPNQLLTSSELLWHEWNGQSFLKVCPYMPRGHIFDIPVKEQMKIWMDASSPQVFEHFGSPRSLNRELFQAKSKLAHKHYNKNQQSLSFPLW